MKIDKYIPGMSEASVKALVDASTLLNSRPWEMVFEGIPKDHPRNEETPEEKAAREAKEAEEAEAQRLKDEEDKKNKKDPPPDDGDDDTVSLSKAEAARLRRRAKEADEADRKAKEAKDAADRKKKQDEGRYQELVSDAEKERDEAKVGEQKAKDELANFKFETRVSRLAGQVGFLDPEDALSQSAVKELEKDASDKEIEAVLASVLKKKPYMKNPRASSGGPGGGNGNGNGNKTEKWTFEDIKAMSTDQINANWNKPGFQEALAAGGQ